MVEEAGVEYPERTTDYGQATGKLYHLRLRVECTLFCNLQSRARTHAVLMIGLYELLGNPTSSYNVYYIDTALLVALQCNKTFQKGTCFSLSEAQ